MCACGTLTSANVVLVIRFFVIARYKTQCLVPKGDRWASVRRHLRSLTGGAYLYPRTKSQACFVGLARFCQQIFIRRIRKLMFPPVSTSFQRRPLSLREIVISGKLLGWRMPCVPKACVWHDLATSDICALWGRGDIGSQPGGHALDAVNWLFVNDESCFWLCCASDWIQVEMPKSQVADERRRSGPEHPRSYFGHWPY